MKIRLIPTATTLLLITATSSWASGPADLSSPALFAYLFIYTCILATAGVLIGGLYLTRDRREQTEHRHHAGPPHHNPAGRHPLEGGANALHHQRQVNR